MDPVLLKLGGCTFSLADVDAEHVRARVPRDWEVSTAGIRICVLNGKLDAKILLPPSFNSGPINRMVPHIS